MKTKALFLLMICSVLLILVTPALSAYADGSTDVTYAAENETITEDAAAETTADGFNLSIFMVAIILLVIVVVVVVVAIVSTVSLPIIEYFE